MNLIRSITYFILLGRPVFLAGGFLLHGLGVAMAVWQGTELSIPILIWGQLAVTSIQIMTHYSNDYFDLAADRANETPTSWSGGSRILPDGLLEPRIALWTAAAAGFLALAAAIWLAMSPETGPLTFPLLLLAISLAWSYSSPPISLNNRGLGEISGPFIITLLTPLVGYYLQAAELTLLPFLTVFPLCCLQFAMLLVINFPDAAGDAAAGKKTLVVILGPERASRLYIPALLLAYGSLPIFLLAGLPALVALSVLIPFPISLWMAWRMKRDAWADPTQWNSLGFWSVAMLIGTMVCLLLAYGLLLWHR